jgi:hypothetical protein
MIPAMGSTLVQKLTRLDAYRPAIGLIVIVIKVYGTFSSSLLSFSGLDGKLTVARGLIRPYFAQTECSKCACTKMLW